MIPTHSRMPMLPILGPAGCMDSATLRAASPWPGGSKRTFLAASCALRLQEQREVPSDVRAQLVVLRPESRHRLRHLVIG